MPRTMTKWIINEKLISRTLLIYAFLSDPKDVSAFSLKEKKKMPTLYVVLKFCLDEEFIIQSTVVLFQTSRGIKTLYQIG